jgi:hypothetical protein
VPATLTVSYTMAVSLKAGVAVRTVTPVTGPRSIILVTMRQAWRSANNVSGTLPEYIAVMTGTGLHVSGGYWGPAAAKDYNAKNGVVYGTAQNHVFTGVYNEWTCNFYCLPLGLYR